MAEEIVDPQNYLVARDQIPSSIVFPENGKLRSRKVVTRSNRGHVYKFASQKCGRTLHLESTLEYDRAILLEFDRDVIRFQEQPFRLKYADSGEVKIAFPDLLVYKRGGAKVIEEIKGEDDLPEYRHKFEVEGIVLRQHGYEFIVHTEKYIHVEPRFSNAKKLLPYRRFRISDLLRERVRATLEGKTLSGRDLCSQIDELSIDDLLAMVAQGHISADLSSSFGQDMKFN